MGAIRKHRASGRRPAPRWGAVCIGLAVLAAACGSDSEQESGSEAPAPTTPTSVAEVTPASGAASDRALVAQALISPEDYEGHWREDPDFLWPNSAELARTAPACEPFADLVFEGGAEHGTGESVTLSGVDDTVGTLLSYVVLFPTAEEAAAMVSAVASPKFDDCWAQYQGVAMQALPMGVTEAHYETATPPELSLDADSYVTRSLTGTAVIDGTEFGDTCICVFAQVGRGVVEVHSAAADFDPEERTAAVQVAIDKLRDVIG